MNTLADRPRAKSLSPLRALLPFLRPYRGVLAAAGGVIRLPHRIPFNVAMEMALTGTPQSAERLFALGLMSKSMLVTLPGIL